MSKNNSPWGILTGIRPAKIAAAMLAGGSGDSEIIDRFTHEYGASIEKATLALNVARVEFSALKSMKPRGVSLYIGIPFCPTRCLYCSFVTCGTKNSAKLIPAYIECLKREIKAVGEIIRERGMEVETVYFGGGTPTTLTANQLDDVISALENELDLSQIKEFTVEAGRPDTITCDKLKTLKAHNVGRISINPQTMNGETLHLIGRAHSPEQIEEAFAMARECSFDCINADLIAGLPGENSDMFKRTVERVLKLDPENITVHTMSIKRSSRLHENLGDYALTDAGTVGSMVDYAASELGRCGYAPYYLYRQKNILGNLENVGYTKPGFDGIYNIYIMEELQTIISLGCGGVTKAVFRDENRIERVFNVKEPQDYIARIDEMIERKRNFL